MPSCAHLAPPIESWCAPLIEQSRPLVEKTFGLGVIGGVPLPNCWVRRRRNPSPRLLNTTNPIPADMAERRERKMATTPNWKLRRLAARTLRVIERHKTAAPVVAAFEITLAPKATEFVETYDRLRLVENQRQVDVAEGHAAAKALAGKVRSWANQVSATKMIAMFDATTYGNRPGVPDDVITDANHLVESVKGKTSDGETAPAWVAPLLADLEPAIALAQKEWAEAEALKSEYTSLINKIRTCGEDFSDLLIAFRRTLRSTIGSAHPDFQSLRVVRIDRSAVDEEEGDDEAEASHSELSLVDGEVPDLEDEDSPNAEAQADDDEVAEAS